MRASDACPTPKSSIAIPSPHARSSYRTCWARSGSAIAVASLTSTVTRRGSTPASRSRPSSDSDRRGDQSWRGERLNPICRSTPSSRQRRCWRPSSSTTHSPIDSIRPISSARGRNSPGGTRPPLWSRQRISASTPRTDHRRDRRPAGSAGPTSVPARHADAFGKRRGNGEWRQARSRLARRPRARYPPGRVRLLRYIAASACFKSVAASDASRGNRLMPDARRERVRATGQVEGRQERLVHSTGDPLGDRDGVSSRSGFSGKIADHDQELVAAAASDDVGLSHRRVSPARRTGRAGGHRPDVRSRR